MSEKAKFNYREVTQAKLFKWMAFFFAVYLIVIGSMLVYESSRDAIYDTDTNIPLIALGSVAIALSAIILIALVYVQKNHPSIPLAFCYAITVMIMFGTTVGTISIINGVDVPNLGSRGTLGWVFGGITTGVGVIGALWTIFALVVTYNSNLHGYPFTKFAVLEKDAGLSRSEIKRLKQMEEIDKEDEQLIKKVLDMKNPE